MPRRQTINDDDREQWISNDEGLYDMQRKSGLSMRRFIRKHRTFIDRQIRKVRDGWEPAHSLKYGR